jgi:hypothetical protein
VGWWNVRSFLNEWSCGNVGFWRFSATMTRIVLGEIGRRLHLILGSRRGRTIGRPSASRRLRRVGSSRARWFRSAPGRTSSRPRPYGPEQGPVLRSLRDAPLLWQDLSDQEPCRAVRR